jgi:hypothetical protein
MPMNDRVAAVIDGFTRLTPEERIVAFLEIEEVWKASQRGEEPVLENAPRARSASPAAVEPSDRDGPCDGDAAIGP